MKKLLLAVFMLPWLSFVLAQGSSSLPQQLQHRFAPLDKTQVPGTVLFDLCVPLVNPSLFRGVLHDSNYADINSFGALYGQFRMGSVLPTSELPSPEVYLDKIAHPRRDTVPLAYMAMQYGIIRPDAILQNLLSYNNGQIFDVLGRTQSPYLSDTTFIASPLQATAKNLSLVFEFPQELLFSNLSASATEYAFDAGDGSGWHTLTPGSCVSISYPDAGTKTLRFRATYPFGQRFAHSNLVVEEALAAKVRGGMPWPQELQEVIHVTATTPYLEVAGEADVFFFYNTNNCNPIKLLRRPLIIIEGFEEPNVTESTPARMFELLDKTDWSGATKENLTDNLFPHEYDLIYVNLKNGNDYAQRNAFLIEEVIRLVNQMKAANPDAEQNVVIGVSMGGIISNYALRHMAATGQNHDTRLFLTYDSPMRGANIPIGTQHLVKFMKDNLSSLPGGTAAIPALNNAWLGINRPIAKQLLLYHYSAQTNPIIPGVEPVNPEQVAFFEEMNALGPLPMRYVAISNGSANTFLENSMLAGEKFFDLHGHKTVSIKIQTFNINFDINLDIELRATGNNTITKVFDGALKLDVPLSLNLLGGIPDIEIESSTIAFTKPYDVVPGGTSILGLYGLGDVKQALEEFGIPVTGEGLTATQHTFIPTFSSVNASLPSDFSIPQTCGSADRCSISETKTTSQFTGLAEFNQSHVFLDARIATLLIDELVTNTPAPPASLLFALPGGKLEKYFNVARYQPAAIPSLDILPGTGRLSINNSGKINFATPTDPFAQSANFIAHTACNAVVNIENSGKLFIGDENNERNANLYVSGGSSIRVKTGGLLKIFGNSRLFLLEGSTVIIESGAMLDCITSASLVVQSGATLIIEPGAEITLRDNPNGALSTEGRPKITVEPGGKLLILGNFNFKGDGYFEFNPGHLTELPASFSFTGSGKTYRNIKLNRNAVLVKKGGSLNLLSTRVVYERDASIKAEGFNRVVLQQATFEPDAAKGYPVSDQQMALYAQGGQQVFVVGCDFKDFKNSLRFYDVNNYIRFSESNFNNTVGAHVYNGKNVVLNGVEGQVTAFLFDKISTGVTMRNSNLKGAYVGLSNGHSFNEMIKLRDVKMFVMEGGVLSGDEGGYNGIDASEGLNNIVLSNGATIEKTLYGVVMEGIYANNYAQSSPDYGLLRMDCARILDCVGAGVHGTDILLDIDAGVNSNGMRPNEFRANAALVGSGTLGLIFDICYITRTPSEISANYNFWNVYGPGGNSVGPTPNMYSLYRRNPNANNCNWNAIAVPLTTNFVASGYDSSCPGKGGDGGFAGDIQSRGGLTYKDCFIGNQALYQQFSNAWSAWEASHELAVEADAEPDYTTALANFLSISQIDSVILSPLASQCRHYNAVARTFIKATDKQKQQQVQQPLEQRVHTTSAQELAQVSPNPATGGFNLSLPEGDNWQVSVSDVNGKVRLLSSNQSQQYVSTQDWSAGIYTIYYVDRTDSKRQGQVRVLVQ